MILNKLQIIIDVKIDSNSVGRLLIMLKYKVKKDLLLVLLICIIFLFVLNCANIIEIISSINIIIKNKLKFTIMKKIILNLKINGYGIVFM